MSIEITDLMHLAKRLSDGAHESEWRAGASRAYYAAYHRALEVADRHLPPSRTHTGVHAQLQKRLSSCGKKGGGLAYALNEMKKVRTHADYRLTIPFEQQDASALVLMCELFMPKADALASDLKSAKRASS